MPTDLAKAPATEARAIPRLSPGFDVRLALPGSKSIALRQLLIASLAPRPTRLVGIPRCDDVDAMLDAIGRLGGTVERDGDGALISPPPRTPRDVSLHLGMSGVSLRFLIARAGLNAGSTQIGGHPQLSRRPNADLLNALRHLGCQVSGGSDGFAPVTVRGPSHLGAETKLRTSVSSQFLSALLLSAPAFPQGLTIHLEDERASASYVALTTAEMARRGVEVLAPDEQTLVVPPAQYTGGDATIEGDASAATYHAALATLHGGTVTLTNLGESTVQGDYAFIGLCERLGATIRRESDQVRIHGAKSLRPLGNIDMSNMPDAAPTLMAIAPFLPTPTHITGLATLRIKECDRIAAGCTELRRAGVAVEEFEDAMTVHPPRDFRPTRFATYEDHRMAMAMSVLASRIGHCEIEDPDCVAKTYADYWHDFESYVA
ncbi:MAG: 3-phosphoshikimate 1-carboxyvinyltransferase [Gammaproteobacteria bacterium]|nr:3-phosphoshikimate 1-carboxyvinyltransferase [Gammaproteobacteria bacterium]